MLWYIPRMGYYTGLLYYTPQFKLHLVLVQIAQGTSLYLIHSH